MTETEENQVTKVDLDMSPQRRIEGWGSNMQYDADGNVSRIYLAYLKHALYAKTRPETRLTQSRTVGEGQYYRTTAQRYFTLAYLAMTYITKKRQKQKAIQEYYGPMDGRTNRPTD